MDVKGRVHIRSFAKINLSLRVLSIRPDGFHGLETTFQSLALHDTITFTARPGPFQIECDDPSVPADERNLVWGAAERVWRVGRRRSEPAGVFVRINKKIPAQAGLGGGSSNAAGTLRALASLWRVKLSAVQLQRQARALGADVPFFLVGGTAVGVERGDEVRSVADRPARWVVVVLPGFGVSTKEAYGWWDDDAGELPREGLLNDLQAPVVKRHPEIGRIIELLQGMGAVEAAMSGSGSAVFGLFKTATAAKTAAKRLEGLDTTPLRTILTKTLSRSRYQSQSKPVLSRKRSIG